MAATRTSAPGSRPTGTFAACGRRGFPRLARGFTLVELLIVIALIALASGIASLALRDSATAELEQEGVRLAALLEAARAESRASGAPVRWVVLQPEAQGGDAGFRFTGLPADGSRPQRWLHEGVSAQVLGATALQLGPEPVIGPQRVLLRLEDRRLLLATDGLAPFAVATNETPAEASR